MKRTMKHTVSITASTLALALTFAVIMLLQAPATSMAQTGDHNFSETGHVVPAIFYQYWLSHGGLEQQGYPVTDAKMEKNSVDGKEYLTQYFERARFEQHLEFKGTRNEVLLGLLGVEVLKCRGTVAGGTSQKDAKDSSDFKFIPRPAASYIKTWCVVPYCGEAAVAAGSGGGKDDIKSFIAITYRTVDESNFNTQAVNKFYMDTLLQAGWTLGPTPGTGDNQGQVFLPPDNLKDKVKRVGIWFTNPAGNLTIGVVRTTPIGDPPDLSLFVGH
ncbi:MAG: hypothetical protein ABI670_11180 [Chloroflexota bacterium]